MWKTAAIDFGTNTPRFLWLATAPSLYTITLHASKRGRKYPCIVVKCQKTTFTLTLILTVLILAVPLQTAWWEMNRILDQCGVNPSPTKCCSTSYSPLGSKAPVCECNSKLPADLRGFCWLSRASNGIAVPAESSSSQLWAGNHNNVT